MATILKKAVRRQLLSSTDRKGRAILVTLEPGDMISFRPKGSKRSVSVYLGHCMSLAQIVTLESEYNAKVKEYQLRKKAGAKGIRRPKKPCLPFGKIYFQALKS